jgi:3-hydroxyisobutyrate dehydrogenase-like beta-hydroxyacid dehydrogenase
MRVGFIGVGHMGRGMAASLLKTGHEVIVYERSGRNSAELEAAGAAIATDIAGACQADAIFTMLPDDQAVENVVFAMGGIIDSLPQGATHISSSTISVAMSDRLTLAHAAAGQHYVAATVLGRPDVAAQGQLVVVAAAPDHSIDRVSVLLDAIGRTTVRFGDQPSNANLVKLSANFLFASVMESLGEAVALVAKGGIDKHAYVAFLTSTMFNAPAYKIYGELAVSDEPTPVGFAAPLGFKDIRLAMAAGEKLSVPMPLLSLLHDRFAELMASGGETMDWSAIGKLAQRDAGLLDLAA